jgi:hypothetical protein
MKRITRNLLLLTLLICLVSSLVSGCIVFVRKTTTIVHIPPCFLLIRQQVVVARILGSDDTCRVLFGFQIPQDWDIVSVDTLKIEGDLYATQQDAGVTTDLDTLYPKPDYKWVGFSTTDSINSAQYPDTSTATIVFKIDRNLPSGPEEAWVYERAADDCNHDWDGGINIDFFCAIIPTLTQWGVIILVALLVGSAVFIMLRRRKAAVPA